MESSARVRLVRNLLKRYYEYGDVLCIVKHLHANAIGFGTQSVGYASGIAAIETLLKDEYKNIEPARILRMRVMECEADKETAVQATVIFQAGARQMAMVHRFTCMLSKEVKQGNITGIHIVHDRSHEAIYKKFRGQTLVKGEESAQEDVAPPLMEESEDSWISHMQSAYILTQTDPCRTFISISDAFVQMLGYGSKEELLEMGGNLASFLSASTEETLSKTVQRQLVVRKQYKLEYPIRKKDGTWIRIVECGTYILDRERGIGTLQGTLVNVSPLKRAYESTVRAGMCDPLTGIYNKNAFCRRVQEKLRDFPELSFEVLCFDVARFKVINDLFGEEVGDQLLCYIARFLENINLENCVYARFHSDNFYICYPGGEPVRTRIISSLNLLASSFALDYQVEFAFGVYRITDPTLSVMTMCDRALIAMSRAKSDGFVKLGLYSEEMRTGLVDEQTIVNHMHEALERGEFRVYLQSKCDLATGKIMGAEALVRWIHPKLGFIAPDRFIPVFERNGFIYPMDCYVWEEVCKILRRQIDEGLPVFPISINVSRVDIYTTGIVEHLVRLVQRYDLPQELLELEVTESVYTENPKHIIAITKELRARGFRILMDDFGSGYSSLNMLKDMPVDVLKIDLKFLAYEEDSTTESRGNQILESIVRMAKLLDIFVIVEGVETKAQVEFMRSIGCVCGQGYYFSKPVPVEEYEQKVLAQHNEVA